MKVIMKATVLILVMATLVVILAVPVFAYEVLPTKWANYIKSFPEIRMNVDRDQYHKYIMTLQRYLMCFDYVCKEKLYYNGGYMDGDFGGRTKAAVIYLQGQLGFTGEWVDGAVGTQTWTRIANSLRLYSEYYNRIRRPAGIPGQWVYGIGENDGSDFFGYFGEDNGNALTPV